MTEVWCEFFETPFQRCPATVKPDRHQTLMPAEDLTMNLFSVLLFSLFFTLPFAHADESEIRVTLPSVQFSGRASFETLNQDTFVPATETKLGGEHATTLDTFQ
jgi:hypothetical protein